MSPSILDQRAELSVPNDPRLNPTAVPLSPPAAGPQGGCRPPEQSTAPCESRRPARPNFQFVPFSSKTLGVPDSLGVGGGFCSS